MTRMAFALSVVLLMLGVTSTAQARSVVRSCPGVVKSIYHERGVTRAYERRMGHNPSKSVFNASKVHSCAYAKWVRDFWKWMHNRRTSEYQHWKKQREISSPSWLVSAFMCIHHYEGAWNSNTGNGYYGGLQFGWSEWQRFGGRYASRADLATPAQQIAAGIAYYNVSGFSPWPNTAAACGLL